MSISLDTLDVDWDDFPEYDIDEDVEEEDHDLFGDSDKQLLNKLPEYDSSSDSEESYVSGSTPPASPTSTAATLKPSPESSLGWPLEEGRLNSPTALRSTYGLPTSGTVPVIMSTVSLGVMKRFEDSKDNRKIIPRSTASFVQASQDVGAFWIDKTLFIREFFKPSGASSFAFPAIHRPRGFGKTALLDTISWFVDANAQLESSSTDVFNDTSLYTGSALDSSAQSFLAYRESMLVLHLDLATIVMDSPRGFEMELRVVLSHTLRSFGEEYKDLLDLPPDYLENPDIWDEMGLIDMRAAVEVWMRDKYHFRIFLAIDNYNYPQIESNNSYEVQNILALHLFSPLVAICPHFATHGLLFGSSETNNPDIENVWRGTGLIDPWWTNHSEFATSCGFTLKEIQVMCAILGTDPPTFTDEVRKNLKAYQPCSDMEPVWSCEDVFRRFTDKLGESCRTYPRTTMKFC